MRRIPPEYEPPPRSPAPARLLRLASATARRLPALVAIVLALGAAREAGAQALRIDADAAARRATEVSHRATAAAERVNAASAEVDRADADRMPTLSASAAVQRRNSVPELTLGFNPSAPATTIFPNIPTVYDFGVDVTQPIYTGGALEAAREASRHELDATRAEESATRNDIALQARLAYWRAAADLAAVGSAESQQTRAERLLQDARSLREAGMVVDADVLAAQAREAASRLAVIRVRTTAEDSMAALRSLLGLPPGTTLELADAVPDSLPAAPQALAELQAEARGARPELAALIARIEASASRATLAGAPARPTVRATFGWNVARPNPRFLPLTASFNDSWSAGVMAKWTFWDGGRTDAAVAAAEARRRGVEEELAETARRIDLAVEQARLQLDAALAAVEAADASRQASAARITAEEDRYREGLATISDVLAAQAELVAAETQQIATRIGAWTARARLDATLGR